MPTTALSDRAIVSVAGDEAEHFLDNLITCQVIGLEENDARFGALLTPQGKILFDFFLIKTKDAFLIDVSKDKISEFTKRLMFYRLRAKVEIVEKADMRVAAEWNDTTPTHMLVFADPRHKNLGYRIYDDHEFTNADADYTDLCVSLGIPTGGLDFEYGDAYPHEVLMDQFGGIDFKKGCYVGQEVVSRMQHRGSTKKRLLKITSLNEPLVSGMTIKADGKPAGVVGAVSGKNGLGIVRVDRLANATTILADEIEVKATIPDWVDFGWPETG